MIAPGTAAAAAAAADRTLLAERIAAIPAALAQAAAAPPPALDTLLESDLFIVTGGGLSEGPARVLVALLQRLGRPARFVPQSTFAEAALPRPGWLVRSSAPALILFSQGLAPNAQLPLAHLQHFKQALLFTSLDSDTVTATIRRFSSERQLICWQHAPACEDRLLLRLIGPALAIFCALRFVQLLAPSSLALAELPRRYAQALAQEVHMDLFGDHRRPIALVGGEAFCELAMPLRWKLLEGLRVPDPPVWDLLQIVHGPIQSFFAAPLTLLLFLDSARPQEELLGKRLISLLDESRHQVLRIPYTQQGGAELLLLDARLNAALLRTLENHPLELSCWPLRGEDGPLYDVSPATLKFPVCGT